MPLNILNMNLINLNEVFNIFSGNIKAQLLQSEMFGVYQHFKGSNNK